MEKIAWGKENLQVVAVSSPFESSRCVVGTRHVEGSKYNPRLYSHFSRIAPDNVCLYLGKYTVGYHGHAVVKGIIIFTLLCCYIHQMATNTCSFITQPAGVLPCGWVYLSGSHDAVAIAPVLHGTTPEIFSRNHLRIADKTVRGDDCIVESNHQERLRVFHFRTKPAPL